MCCVSVIPSASRWTSTTAADGAVGGAGDGANGCLDFAVTGCRGAEAQPKLSNRASHGSTQQIALIGPILLPALMSVLPRVGRRRRMRCRVRLAWRGAVA